MEALTHKAGASDFDGLPAEVRHLVFRHFNYRELCVLSMVSKHWHGAVAVALTVLVVVGYDGMLPGWKQLDVYHHRQRVDDDSLEGLFRYPSRLTHTRFVGLSTCRSITDRTVLTVSRLCLRLLHLSLFECTNVTDVGVAAIWYSTPGPEALRCLAACERITDASLQSVSTSLPELRILEQMIDLERCPLHTDAGIVAVCSNCPHLRNLRKLALGRSPHASGIEFLTHHTALEVLDLSENRHVAGPHLIQIGEVCTRLRILDISYTNWRAIPAASLMPVARNCPRLEILNVASCKKLTDTVITTIGSNCPGLRKVVLSGCLKLTDDSVVTVARNCSDIKEMQLAGLGFLTDESLMAVGENCPLIEFITLSQLQRITDDGLLHLGRLQQIKTLVITQCSLITDDGVAQLRRNTRRIPPRKSEMAKMRH
ncbi:Fbox domain containing protein [Acanthamoeba castellanii str. Neff]|uniref:Fbox domain containing protein n=1 Tax=Acanthamoeba castellanii (strain ATCC 30010 / Neff) TaxID=1257118 RepID=L8H6G6_ACACF|nr:Fbox domain containing protein [Acanthamoeba castellanii str. Neff]ELR20837.1 Fbox domain containing protein [Acanthamoeba castellanii str. Neff]